MAEETEATTATTTTAEVIHLDPQEPGAIIDGRRVSYTPCGAERVAGMLLTGDPAQVTCPGCKEGGR